MVARGGCRTPLLTKQSSFAMADVTDVPLPNGAEEARRPEGGVAGVGVCSPAENPCSGRADFLEVSTSGRQAGELANFHTRVSVWVGRLVFPGFGDDAFHRQAR